MTDDLSAFNAEVLVFIENLGDATGEVVRRMQPIDLTKPIGCPS